MAPDGSGRRTRRVDQDTVKALAVILAEPLGAVGHDKLCLQRQPREIVAQPRHTGGRSIDCRHACPAMDKLCGLAAGRGAEVDDSLAGYIAEQACWKRGSGIL